MGKIFKRWHVWLGLALLLGLAGSLALICSSKSRLTQANFDRIQEGMSEPELVAILGVPDPEYHGPRTGPSWSGSTWSSGPNWICVSYAGSRVYGKAIHLAGCSEILQWYVKKGGEKIGAFRRVPDPMDEVMD